MIGFLVRVFFRVLLIIYSFFDSSLDTGFNIPNLTAVIGDVGSGKSLYALSLALYFANKYQKSTIITNFQLNRSAVREYCIANNLRWFLRNGSWRYCSIESAADLYLLFDVPSSVVIFDEAGVDANSQDYRQASRKFRERLFQLRKTDQHLIVCFQYWEQVLKVFREMFQLVVSCSSQSSYSIELRAPKAFLFQRIYYKPDKLEHLIQSSSTSSKEFAPYLISEKFEIEFIPWGRFLNDCSNLIRIILSPGSDWRRSVRRYRTDILFSCYASTGFVGGSSGTLSWSLVCRPGVARSPSAIMVTPEHSSSHSNVIRFPSRSA